MKPLQMVFTWWPGIHAGACALHSHLTSAAILLSSHILSCAFDTSVHSCHATHLLENLLPASRQLGSGGNERLLMCITSLSHYITLHYITLHCITLLSHYIRYYIQVTHTSIFPYRCIALHLCNLNVHLAQH